MSEFQPFVMERMMSKYEQTVDYNLSESGVHPIPLGELLAGHPEALKALLATDLNYPHVEGIPALRRAIAALYQGADPENVLVTVGAIEANYLAVRTLLSPGDEIVVMLPNYMQIWGIAKNHGLALKTFRLREERGWAPDLDELAAQVSAATKVIAICNPNNPTGRILTEAEMDGVVAVAERVGAWILADEVYRGAERTTDVESPSFYGRYPRVIATGSMSKAYGMPGLRIGWAVAPPEVIDGLWARHEYLAISATMLANQLAAFALLPEIRPTILERTRRYLREGFPALEGWLAGHGDTFQLTPPQASAVAFLRYRLAINSSELTDRLRREKSVLIVPGDHFGMDRFLRVSFGLPHEVLVPALDHLHDLIEELSGVPG